MGISTQTITVDLSKQLTRPQVVRLGQGDRRGTTLVADIYDNGVAYSLNGKTARFSMRAPDGASSYSVAASSSSGNKATFDLDETYAASIAGKTDTAYIEILSGSTVICSTSRITVVVYRSASQGLPVSGAYSDALEEAISSAQSAASSANSAASNANTKATRAENAATAANNAAQSANTAKDAANAAASAATTAAGAANSAASAATSAKDAANAAATAANTAADSANAATSEANAAIEAMGDISELAVPEMTASVRGGAKVGGSTQVVGGKLEVKLSESATGTSVTTGSTSALRELQVHGKSVQDGTPTPDAPIPVEVVGGRNLLPLTAQTVTNKGVTATVDATGTMTITGIATGGNAALTIPVDSDVPLANNVDYTAQRITVSGSLDGTFYVRGIDDDNQTVHNLFNLASVTERTARFTNNAIVQALYIVVSENTTIDCVLNVQVERGSTATSYTPYGSIGIVVGDTATPIDLQGNKLASLSNYTRDELHIDSAGHVWIVKRVGTVTFDGDEPWSKAAIAPYNMYIKSETANSGFSDIEIAETQYNPKGIVLLCNRFEFKGNYAEYKNRYGLTISGTSTSTNFCFDWRNIAESMTVAEWKAWLVEHLVTVHYPLAIPQEIDLGYIDPPAIPSGSVVTISASLTPTFDLSCWTEHASELADTTATLANEISSLRAQIAALATS